MTYEEQEEWDSVQYRMDNEGIDYCFEHYSSFEEIKDEKFHELRLQFLKSLKEIRNYVNEKCQEEVEEDDEYEGDV
jgi:hypothetical protein